jgi:probable phosphoglycerate mutase
MTRLILTRHAESIWHGENRYAGSSDIRLTERGRRQADRLGRWAATAGLDAVWASPMQRTRATAAPAAAATGLEVTVDERLREVDFGWLEGRTREEAGAERPAELRAYLENPVDNVFPGAESPRAAVARGLAALAAIALRHPRQRVLVVGHSTLLRLLLCALLNIPLERYRSAFPALGNCALTEIDLVPEGAGLITLNLPPYSDGRS